MSADFYRFIPVAGALVGLIVAFAFNPAAGRAAWWGIPVGLLAGYVVRFGVQRYVNARR